LNAVRETAAAPTRQVPVAIPPFPWAECRIPLVVFIAIALVLACLVMLGAGTSDAAKRELYWSLALAPIIRIGSLSLPLGRLPLLAWYPLIGIPIFASAFITKRKLGYTNGQVGLRVPGNLVPQVLIVPLGAILGIGEYLIFRPAPLADRFTLASLWQPALVLLIFTGFEEELIFRGLMQRAALRALGRWGLIYVNLIFAALHIGYLSALDLVFVFFVGLLFAVFALKTRSIAGVTFAHGAVNISLFLVLPYVAPIVLGTGYGDLLPLPVPPTQPPR
jgi:membrane protease YdiL (CAAX protease family)